MRDHFAGIAGVYRDVRTTDDAPVRHIRKLLGRRGRLRVADIGCGDGRYDRLLLRCMPALQLTCVDISREMLAELSRNLAEDGFENFETVLASVEELDLESRTYDAVLTFNAVHHFDFPHFLAKATGPLRDDGVLVIYTRTPEQNAETIWGRYFPDFAARESRLYRLDDMRRWIDEAKGLRLVGNDTFRYARRASLERLLSQARKRHYSTFSLYGEAEFGRAVATFEARIRRAFDDPSVIEWQDENLLLEIRRQP